MDAKNSLIKATKTQTIPLHPFDMMTGVVNIIYICYYKNTLGSDTFMPTDMLRDSFFTTLADFPILLGRLQVDGSGKTVVVVDENNLNMPDFKETQSDIHFGHLQSAGFSWSTMPQGTVAVRSVATVGDQGYIKLANVHIVRLKDNSGVVLTVGLSHYVVDGIGYCTFMNQWAKNCTHLQNGTPNNGVHARTLNFDRQTVARCLPSRGSTVDQATRSLYSTDGYMARWLAWLTPESRGSVFSVLMALDNCKAHVFHISAATLSSLRSSLSIDIVGGLHISDNDIITALLSMVIAQGEKQATSNNRSVVIRACCTIKSAVSHVIYPFLKPPTSNWVTSIAVDIRGRIDTASTANYTGNMVIGTAISTPLCLVESDITDESLAHVAAGIRQAVLRIDGHYIRQVADEIGENPSGLLNTLVNLSTLPKSLLISNHSRFPLYNANFGSGIPAWVSPTPESFLNYATVLPRHPHADGYNLCISTRLGTMQAILSNPFWQNVARLLY